MTSKFVLKLLRAGAAKSSLPSITDVGVIGEPIFTRPSFVDTVNDIRVQYAKREEGALLIAYPIGVSCDFQGELLYVVMSDGIVYSLGGDYGVGGLGDGTLDYADTFEDTRVVTYSGKMIAVAAEHPPVAIDSVGQLLWWGNHGYYNYGTNSVGYKAYGGNPDLLPYDSLVPVEGVADITFGMVSVGYYCGCGIDSAGQLWTWGYGGLGTLGRGLGDGNDRLPAPGKVTHPEGKTWVYCHTRNVAMCGIDSAGQLWTWGDNSTGMLGIGLDPGVERWRDTPQKVGTDTDWVKCIVSEVTIMAMKSNGEIWGMGTNFDYILGHAQADAPGCGADDYDLPSQCEHWSPHKVADASNGFIDFCFGYYHTIALKSDGTAWGMGYDGYDGGLGLGDNTDFVTGWTQITGGVYNLFSFVHSFYGVNIAIGLDNNVYIWGTFYGLDEWYYPYPTRWQLPNQEE